MIKDYNRPPKPAHDIKNKEEISYILTYPRTTAELLDADMRARRNFIIQDKAKPVHDIRLYSANKRDAALEAHTAAMYEAYEANMRKAGMIPMLRSKFTPPVRVDFSQFRNH